MSIYLIFPILGVTTIFIIVLEESISSPFESLSSLLLEFSLFSSGIGSKLRVPN